jgi:hypothetical protein
LTSNDVKLKDPRAVVFPFASSGPIIPPWSRAEERTDLSVNITSSPQSGQGRGGACRFKEPFPQSSFPIGRRRRGKKELKHLNINSGLVLLFNICLVFPLRKKVELIKRSNSK